MQTPFSLLARHVTLGERMLRWATTAALVVSIFIVLGGGVVRVTGSGLGCPTWPECEAGSLTATPALGIHGFIEFTNRMLTTLLVVTVGWAIVSARLQRHRDRTMTRLAWSQFWLVVANAIAGGITVLTGLDPYIVALHFLAAIALLTTTAFTWHRAHRSQGTDVRLGRWVRRLSVMLVAVTGLLVVVGTLVTGSGPHSGDSAEVPRMRFVWEHVTVLHGTLGAATLVLAIAVWLLARREGARLATRRSAAFVAILVLQAALGLVQSLTGLPSALVALHVLGAALVWVGVLRVLLDTHPELLAVGAREAVPEDTAIVADARA